MNNLNSIILEGNVSIAPRLVATSTIDGSKLAVFNIATNRYYKDKEGNTQKETFFIEIICWGSLAEGCVKNLELGTSVRVNGRLKISNYTAKDGSVKLNAQIIAQHLEFRKKRKVDGDEENVILENTDEMIHEPIAFYTF